ncbi:uncharacterized protein LOC134537812 isoform X2 [Bacillus rossius redtenbacheri]|uniref:uncharacterized protein LOC134537812 isoform X1 n=1 Tax=Bacillus rossius redtenbacheri TaxID=93214 RepID=UPI002FDDED46
MACPRLLALLAALLSHAALGANWVRDCDETACSRFVCGEATRCVRGYRADDAPLACACYPRVDCGSCQDVCGANASCVCTGMNCMPGLMDCPDASCVVDTFTSAPEASTSPAAE